MGCANPTDEIGKPCPSCLGAFGDRIRRNPDVIPDPEAFQAVMAASDEAIRDILRERAALDHGILPAGNGVITKANQLCWLCEQRKTCAATPHGWECPQCQEVT